MKRVLALGIFLLTAAIMSGQSVLTVDNSGNVTATGAVNGNGLNSQGGAGGQVSISAGTDQLAPAAGFSFQAPGTISNAVQVVVPNAGTSGIWYGVQSNLPVATATLSGGSPNAVNAINISNHGSFMPTAPIVILTPASGSTCSPCAVANAVMTPTSVYPFLTLQSVNVTNGGNYTGSVAPTVSFVAPSGTPSMVNLLFNPISPNFFVKQSVASGTTAPSMPVNSFASENNSAFLPGENIDLQSNATLIEIPNSSTATATNELAVTTPFGSGTTSSVTLAGTGSTTGVVGVCVFNCSNSGNAQIAREGIVSCYFDTSATATPGDFVQASTSTAGYCRDTGSTAYPTNAHQVLGRVLNGGSGSGPWPMILYPAESESVACPTCVTSASALANNALVLGSGGAQGTQTSSNFTVSGAAQLNIGHASTASTLAIYGSGSSTPYTLSPSGSGPSLTMSGSVTLGSAGTANTLTLNSVGTGGITLTPASSSNNVITVPAYTDTLAVIGNAQTFSALQTFSNGITASNGLTANNLTFSGTGSHIQTTPSSGQSDIAGTATITSGTKTVTVTFATNYTSKPVCVVNPEADGTTSFKLWYVTISNGTGHYTLTINTSSNTTANVIFDYICMGNPN